MTRSSFDVARILVVSAAGLTIGLACYIAWRYMRAYFELEPAKRGARWGPLQLAGFAVAHIMYTFYGALTIIEHLGEPRTFDTPYLATANALSGLVLLIAARKERMRRIAARRAMELGLPRRRADDQ